MKILQEFYRNKTLPEFQDEEKKEETKRDKEKKKGRGQRERRLLLQLSRSAKGERERERERGSRRSDKCCFVGFGFVGFVVFWEKRGDLSVCVCVCFFVLWVGVKDDERERETRCGEFRACMYGIYRSLSGLSLSLCVVCVVEKKERGDKRKSRVVDEH